MSRYEVVPTEVGLLSHATTVVTNAILQESGARAALITTRGFRDVLELRRSARAEPLRPVPGCAGHANSAPAQVRDHRAYRCGRQHRHAAR